MKECIFTAAILVFYTIAEAQITLTDANTNPVIGDKYYYRMCDIAGVAPGNGGAGQTWNFQNLVTLSEDSIVFMDCVLAPSCNLFPGTDIVSQFGDTFTYYDMNSSELAILGNISGPPYDTSKLPTKPRSLYEYSMSFNSTFIDDFEGTINTPGLIHYIKGIVYDTSDGYGTLYLPDDTFNAFRHHSTIITTDSINVGGPIVSFRQTDEYIWNRPGVHTPALIIRVDSGYVTSVKYYGLFPTTAHSVKNETMSLSVNPNPAKDNLTIHMEINEAGPAKITVFDVTGRDFIILDKTLSKGKHSFMLNVGDIPKGIYLMRVTINDSYVIEKLELY